MGPFEKLAKSIASPLPSMSHSPHGVLLFLDEDCVRVTFRNQSPGQAVDSSVTFRANTDVTFELFKLLLQHLKLLMVIRPPIML